MAASQLPGPKLVQVSFTWPLCGSGLIAPPPVRNARTWVGKPLLQFGRRGVVGEVEDGLLPVEALQFLVEHVQAAEDQVFRLRERQASLVGVPVAVRHDFVAPGLEIVPQAEVGPRNVGVIRGAEVLHVGGGNHVDAGRQLVLLVDLGRLDRRLLEAVIEAQGDDVPFLLRRFVRRSVVCYGQGYCCGTSH